MRLLMILAVFAAGCASPGAAQAQPQSMIESCLAAAADADAMALCKGVASRACVRGGDAGDSTTELVLCNDEEAELWQKALEAQLGRATARFPERAELMATAQSAWLAWREAECAYQRADAAGGSGESVVALACAIDLTANRVIAFTLAERAGGSVY